MEKETYFPSLKYLTVKCVAEYFDEKIMIRDEFLYLATHPEIEDYEKRDYTIPRNTQNEIVAQDYWEKCIHAIDSIRELPEHLMDEICNELYGIQNPECDYCGAPGTRSCGTCIGTFRHN
jgi:hypothetical protein